MYLVAVSFKFATIVEVVISADSVPFLAGNGSSLPICS